MARSATNRPAAGKSLRLRQRRNSQKIYHGGQAVEPIPAKLCARAAQRSRIRILGIDPGLGITGYGAIEAESQSFKLLEAGVIRTSGKEDIGARINKIYEGIKGLIEEFNPQALVLERLYSHYRHPATAILMGHTRGAICLLAKQYGVTLAGYSATRVKKAVTGAGHASKYQMQRMIQDFFKLKAVPNPPDISDALALAVAHAYISRTDGTAGLFLKDSPSRRRLRKGLN
jgi:crossover junction endodeoxyribonuclease RuvC